MNGKGRREGHDSGRSSTSTWGGCLRPKCVEQEERDHERAEGFNGEEATRRVMIRTPDGHQCNVRFGLQIAHSDPLSCQHPIFWLLMLYHCPYADVWYGLPSAIPQKEDERAETNCPKTCFHGCDFGTNICNQKVIQWNKGVGHPDHATAGGKEPGGMAQALKKAAELLS